MRLNRMYISVNKLPWLIWTDSKITAYGLSANVVAIGSEEGKIEIFKMPESRLTGIEVKLLPSISLVTVSWYRLPLKVYFNAGMLMNLHLHVYKPLN